MRQLMFLACLCIPWTAIAHHGAGLFDQSAFVVFDGVVTEYHWGNPHVYMAVETTGPDGKRFVQQIEGAPASQLLSRGVTRDLLRVGERVTIRANPHHAGPGRTVLGFELTKADGSRYPLTTRALRALGPGAAVATSIAGTWVPQPEGFFALAAAMKQWPLTELAKKAMAEERVAGIRAATIANTVTCIPQGAPFLMANSVPIAIAANARTVTIDIDWAVTRRNVRIAAAHGPGIKPSLLGDSVGHWDGATLVVDTVGFNPHSDGLGFGFPSSKAKHIVERFSLSEDRKRLIYDITIEDPAYLSAPVRFQTTWDYRPGQAMANTPCDQAGARRYLDDK